MHFDATNSTLVYVISSTADKTHTKWDIKGNEGKHCSRNTLNHVMDAHWYCISTGVLTALVLHKHPCCTSTGFAPVQVLHQDRCCCSTIVNLGTSVYLEEFFRFF